MKLDFNDIMIVPEIQCAIESRSGIDIMYNDFGKKHLPIIAAPMDTVIDEKSIIEMELNNINYCIPRGCDFKSNNSQSISFKSYGLDEFIDKFLSDNITYDIKDICPSNYILIDIANGHMQKMTNAVIKFKAIYPHWPKLMVGNVAHPETYRVLSLAGADYTRIGIGNGAGCLTTQQLGIGYPMASLISECYKEKLQLERDGINDTAKIVADGGMKGYSDIIKSLALGADYVMIGSILNRALESAGPTYFMGIEIDQHSDYAKWLFKHGFKLKKKFRGMSTKEVQMAWKKDKIKTSEGVTRYNNVAYSMKGWTENFTDYLKSAMSYTDKGTLEQFIGNVKTINISENSRLRYDK